MVIRQCLPFTGTEHARPVALAPFTKWIIGLHQQAGAPGISHCFHRSQMIPVQIFHGTDHGHAICGSSVHMQQGAVTRVFFIEL